MDYQFLLGGAFLIGWVAVIALSLLRSIRIFPEMPWVMTTVIALSIACLGVVAFLYLYAAVLALTVAVSSLMGGFGIGMVRMRTALPEKVHVVIAVLGIGIETGALLGIHQLDLISEAVILIGLVFVFSSEIVRAVMRDIVGKLATVTAAVMLGASVLLLPNRIIGFALLVDSGALAGVVVGLLSSLLMFRSVGQPQ